MARRDEMRVRCSTNFGLVVNMFDDDMIGVTVN